MARRKKETPTGTMGIAIGVILLFVLSLFPVYYMLITSLKPANILLAQPPRFLFTPTLDNYVRLLADGKFGRYYMNSINVAFWSSLIAVFIGTMMAFAFTRVRFRLRKLLFFLILIPRSFPPVTTIIPIFFAARALGMTDQVITLIVFEAAVRLPLVVWVMRGFLRNVPNELVEAALLDGCGLPGAFFRIVLPLVAPGLVAVGIICFIDTWNAFLVPLVLTNFNAVTAPVAILGYMQSEETLVWGMIAAGGFLTILPILVFSLALHKFLLRGLTSGAVK
ncbi:multiple sugar transport system permease protein [Phyllobacterium sp. CL33Tsu]|uniref:carbohydrate ABC transporter permease n=1 Tax=Phyllobacterium sp. CL33Tsu TaxID=1798191 RepID=UPI0008EB614E|nr:carbohydrate ABC transporter permease [Phyllobacterium sp. CL33Tsu]SFJ28354.1 multiple sugar transport system permease protein [Phyllobacterium sp. CL33Tsu]